jgi:type III pantothenate kinase
MLLAVDVGNTQTVVGLFDGDRLIHSFRAMTVRTRTADELAFQLGGLLGLRGLSLADVDALSVCSVVPALAGEYRGLGERYLSRPALILGPGVKTGMPIRIDNPLEVGPDRIAAAVRAMERHGAPVITVDFGTATNFDVVGPDGDYLGGVLAPGIEISMEALSQRAARLLRIELIEPPQVIGRSTVQALQSGAIYGFAGQVEGIVRRLHAEPGLAQAPVVATGGLAEFIAPHTRESITHVEPDLVLQGLRLLWQRNRA